jgi:hypothetical protein
MALNQKDTDFFRPMWRRVVVTAVVAAWFCYETFFSKDQMWMVITAVGLAYCVWNLFLRYPEDQPGTPPGTTGGGTAPAASSGPPDNNSDGTSPPAAPKT